MTPASAVNLTHRYGDHTVLHDINLDIEPGQLVGLLGPNGAGKSTLINLFNGQRRPSQGQVRLFGEDPRQPRARRRIGVTPQDTALPANLRVGEVIDFVSAHFPDPLDRGTLLERFGLTDIVRRQTGGLSGGQRRRLSVALAFVGRPDLVFLDEPTTGLDVSARLALWEAVRAFHSTGGTVLLTSHYLEEIEALSQRVVVVQDGRILADDSSEAIRRRVGGQKVSFTGPHPGRLTGALSVTRESEQVEILTADADQLVRELVSGEHAFTGLRIDQASLEDAFLTLTSR